MMQTSIFHLKDLQSNNLYLKSLRFWLALLLLSMTAGAARADTRTLLNDLHDMRLACIGSVANFYMYSGLDADRKYKRRMDTNARNFQAAFVSAAQASDTENPALKDISQQWKAFYKLLQSNQADIQDKGFANVRLVDEMGQLSSKIVTNISTLYEQIKNDSNISVSGTIETARDLSLNMQQITSLYAARGTTSLGHVFLGSHNASLEEKAKEFDVKFKELKRVAGDINPGVNRLLHSIESKWTFIEKSVNNYNENTVPFLVVSYNDRILKHLKAIEDAVLNPQK